MSSSMRITNKMVIELLDKNYAQICVHLTREQELALDSATTKVFATRKERNIYHPGTIFYKELAAIGIGYVTIAELYRHTKLDSKLDERDKPMLIAEQIEVLEELLSNARGTVHHFDRKTVAAITAKLSKMSPARMEASLYDVKRGKKSLRKWLAERDYIAERDAEYAAALAKAGRGKENE